MDFCKFCCYVETNWRRQRGGKTGGELLGGLVRCLRVSRSVFLPVHRSEPGAERASQLGRTWGDAGHETEATGAWTTCIII